MQITEPFATTVAAVGPVILLAAALEVTTYHQAINRTLRKRLETYLGERFRTAVRDGMRDGPGEVSLPSSEVWGRRIGAAIGALLLEPGTAVRIVFGLFWTLIRSRCPIDHEGGFDRTGPLIGPGNVG